MLGYEVMIDNASLQVHCHDEAPPEPLVFDLGMRNVNVDYSPFQANFDGLSSPDTSTEIVIPDGNHSAYSGSVYFAGEDHVDGGWPKVIFLPDVPDGYELSKAQYVLTAYREAENGPPTFPWGAAYGSPSTFPFIYCDSSGTSDFHSFHPLPVGGYSGELISIPDTELLSRIVESGSVVHARMWLGRGSSSETIAPIHVAYFALRLTYDPV